MSFYKLQMYTRPVFQKFRDLQSQEVFQSDCVSNKSTARVFAQ